MFNAQAPCPSAYLWKQKEEKTAARLANETADLHQCRSF